MENTIIKIILTMLLLTLIASCKVDTQIKKITTPKITPTATATVTAAATPSPTPTPTATPSPTPTPTATPSPTPTPTATPSPTPTPTATPSPTPTPTATAVVNSPDMLITEPVNKFNLIAGSKRRIHATVNNVTNKTVNWRIVSGDATLSASSGPFVELTVGTSASNCSMSGSGAGFTVSSSTTIVLEAKSAENPTKVRQTTINVCKPNVEISVVPFYQVLYSNQYANLQSFVWGSTNRSVTWSVVSQPVGGDATILDTNKQDLVFKATVRGRYTLRATSVADPTKSNTAILFVTGNNMPYALTPNKTIPVDCSVDPNSGGTVYEVGPSKAYHKIQDVPWPSVTAGDLIRIHNEDATGLAPTTYNEYFQVKSITATRDKPIRVCGVPDASGNLPVINAANATGHPSTSVYSAGYAVIGIGNTGWAGYYQGSFNGTRYVLIEGLKVINSKSSYTYTVPNTATVQNWVNGCACIRQFASTDVVMRGIDLYNCGNGIFTDFNATNGYTLVANTLFEGNHIHASGNNNSYFEHQLYIQGLNQLTQFNLIDEYNPTAWGSNLKSRGIFDIIRYNHFGDNASRHLDLIDNEDAQPYFSFDSFNLSGALGYGDKYSANQIASGIEAHHQDFVYGNTFVNTSSVVPIHYSNDHGSLEASRSGTLYFYNNSYSQKTPSANWRCHLFDTTSGGGMLLDQIEWPKIHAVNNAIWWANPQSPYFFWATSQTQFTTFGKNILNYNWGTGNLTSGEDGTGFFIRSDSTIFQGASYTLSTIGLSNLIGVNTTPFNLNTFRANANAIGTGETLPAPMSELPVRFNYGPNQLMTPRTAPLTMGAIE